MAVTRSKTGALPTPAPAATQKPAKRKNTSASKAASKVAKTEDKPELAEAKAAAEAAAEKNAETTGAAEEAETKNGGVSEAPSATEEQPSTSALEAVKEPAPETAPLPDVTTVLEKPAAAEVVTAEASAPTTAVQPTATVEPAAEAADTTSAPPAPTAPSAATIPAPVTQEAPTKQEPVVAPTEEPSAHTSSTTTSAPAASIKPFDVVVSDIEGTTTPISFVKDNLFPYVTAGLAQFLQKNWGTEELKKAIDGLREQAAKDVADGVPNAVTISVESAENTAEKVQQDVIASIGWQMKADRKIAALKDFQGYMWREGYANGDLKGEIYDDVITALDKWKEQGKKLYIYSSGSVPAQKLLFGYSTKGDILHYFSGHYDTKIGLKVEAESYTKIAQDIGVEPSKILFLSDNIHEIKAAKQAGMQAIVLDRPGNAELSAEDRANHLVVTSFLDIPQP